MRKLYKHIRKFRTRTLLLFATSTSMTGMLHAQTNIANYLLTKGSETYTEISGGTVFESGQYDNSVSSAISMGGTFTFGGVAYTQCYISTNGFITFGAAPSSSSYTPLSTLGSTTGAISAFGQDAGGSQVAGATPEISYLNIGGATGEFVVQFKDHANYYNSADERMNFQIRLNLSTNVIKFVYGNCILAGTSTNGILARVGIRGASTSWASNVNNLMIGNVPAATTCSWADAVTGNANSSSCLYSFSDNPNVSIPNGLTFTWTPSAAPAPVRSFDAVTNITSTGAQIAWTAPTGATQYNVQYRALGSCTWTNFSGNPVSGTSATLTGLLPVTTYQVRVQSSNGTTNAIWSHIPNASGSGNGYTTNGTFNTLCATANASATLASANNICSYTPVTFSLATPTTGAGISYQWQSSTDNVTFTSISGATSETLTTNPNALYYRCLVICSSGPDTVASTPVQMTYTNNITGTTPGVRCGVGTVDLTAASSSGSIVRWYAAASGGAPLGTGSPFTTPSISSTTTYYAAAEVITTDTIRMGTGTTATSSTSYPNPLSAYYGGAKHQMLFLASELQAQGLTAGNITSIAFDVSNVNTNGICEDFTIRLGTTSATSLSGFEPGTSTVYNATFTPSVTGIVTFALSTPFNWDGNSNLIVETVHNAGNSGNGSGTRTRYTTTSFTSVFVYYDDGVTPAGAASFDAATGGNTTTSSNRPNILFGGQKSCSGARIPVTATVNTPPAFSITANQTVCNNAITQLSVTSPLANYTSYTWSPITDLYTDAAATTAYTAGSNASTIYHKSSATGTAAYTANAQNTATLCASAANDTVTVLPSAVTATATPSSICVSGATTLSLVPAAGYGAASFQWQSSANNTTFADVNTATNPTYTTPVTTTNTYYRAVIKNGAGTVCLNSASDTARVYNPQVVSTTPGSRCGTGTVTLGATASDGGLNWYANATGGTPLGTGASFITPSISGTTTYYVQADATPPVTTAVGTATTTIGTSTGDNSLTPFSQYYEAARSQYLLLASDLQASGIYAGNITALSFNITTKNSTLPYTDYTVKLATSTATSLSGIVTPTFTTVYGPASYSSVVGANTFTFAAPFAWDGVSNIIVDVCFANDPGSTGILYTNNDVVSATTKAYTATYGLYQDNTALCTNTTADNTDNTTRIPVISFTMSGCVSPRTAVVATVNPNPTASVTPAGTADVCAGSTTTLTATGGGNYQWRDASGNIAGANTSTYNTGTAGTYSVVVTTPATGCTDTSAPVTVNVNPLPTVFIGNDTTFCSGNTVTLNAGGQATGATFLWNDNSTNQSKDVTTSGTYYVKVTNNNGCFKTDTINVTVNPTPTVELGNDTNLCIGVSYVMNAGNAGASFLWDNNTTGQTRTATSTGTYYVKVTNSFNCAATDTVTATFLPTPVVNLGTDLDVCAGITIALDAGNPGETYLWDDASTQQTREITSSGTYYVAVSNIANCIGRDTIDVVFHPLPVVNLGNDTTFCHGNTLTLNAGNPGADYLWSDNSTNQSNEVSNTGTYSVRVTDGFGCIGTDTINVTVTQLPSGIINATYGDTATYTFSVLNAQNVSNYTWNFGDGSPTETGPVVQHTYATNGIYTVTVTMDGMCNDQVTSSRTVDVYDANGGTGIDQLEDNRDLVLYPNPAKDLVVLEKRNNLKMKHVSVYNVVGQLIYSAKADSEDKHKLNTSGIASGIYTIRVETEKGFIIRKFEIAQ